MRLSDCKHGSIVLIGQTTYRLYRLEQFADGILGTMKMWARVQQCAKRVSGWWDNHLVPFEIRHWSDQCELIDESNTAIAGEKYLTRID